MKKYQKGHDDHVTEVNQINKFRQITKYSPCSSKDLKCIFPISKLSDKKLNNSRVKSIMTTRNLDKIF